MNKCEAQIAQYLDNEADSIARGTQPQDGFEESRISQLRTAAKGIRAGEHRKTVVPKPVGH